MSRCAFIFLGTLENLMVNDSLPLHTLSGAGILP